MKKHYWSGVCRKPRIPAMAEITHTVDAYSIILNATRFSDISLSLMMEAPAGKIGELYASLNQLMRMDGFDGQDTGLEGDCLVFLSISFTDGTGDLRVEVPDVPG